MSNQYVYDFDAPTCGDFGSVVDNDNADAWFDNRQEEHQDFHEGAELLVEDLPVMSNVDSDKGAELPDEEMLDEEEVEAEAGEGTASNAKSADNVAAKETRADIPQISIEKLPGTYEPAEGYSRVAAQLAMEAMIPAKDELSDQGGDTLDAPNRVEKSDGDRASVSSMDVECAADNTVEEGADIIPMRVGNSQYDVACPAEETHEEEAKVNQCDAAEEDGGIHLNQQPAEGNGSAKEDLRGDDDDESSEEKSVVAARSEAENDPEETREPGTDLFNLCRSVTKWRTGVSAGARVASVVPPATRRSAIVTRLDPLAGQKNRASVRKQLTNIRAGRRTISVASTASSRVSSPAVKRSKRSGSLSKSSAAEVAQPKLRSTKSAEDPEPEKVEAKQQAPQRLKRSSAVSTFTFHTDKRAKASDQVGEPYHHVDFVANLRKSSAASPTKKAQPSRTVIQPFKLMTRGSKRKFEEALQSGRLISHPTKGTAAFKSMAEQLLEFERRTPQRFHLRSRKDLEKGPSPITARPDSCTMPMTPHLVTRMRQRSPTCKSSAQLEQEELERIQAHQFKAHKLDPHLLEPGSVPIGRRCRSHEGARLAAETEKRVRDRVEERLRLEEEERLKERAMHEFHARPLPVAILEQVSGVPEKVTLPMTIPESPAFTLKHRVLTRKDLSLEAPRPVTRANPMPYFGMPVQPRPEMRTLEPEPFSFDARDQERAERRERRIQEIRQLEEQVPQFKAQPVPDLEHVALPEKHLRPLTQQEPFHLRVDERGSIKTEQFNKKLKEEEEQLKEHATFRARPCRVTTTAPFVAQRHNRILARVENVELNTVRRARERAEYDAQLAEQRRQNEAAWELRLQEQAEAERQMILQQRKEVVHKANPVRHYKAVVIQQSSRPLTNPRSPCFSDRFDL